ncbi:MAG TPA: 5'-deoxyadenosine deaminase [Vicinamibacterales bacterium]
MSLLIRNATILTFDDRDTVVEGAVSVRDGRIAAVGPSAESDASGHDRVIDAGGSYLLPGFVQTHVHLCQTLFRGLADDLQLLDWLRRRVWPLEAAHTPDTLRASTRLAVHELLRTGTTTVLTMETVHDTDAVFEALAPTGIRAVVGKCLMDAAEDAPPRLREPWRRGLDESVALQARWHGAAGGRLRAALAPRFAVSCSRTLLEAVAHSALESGLLVHTHASENLDEVALVRSRTGLGNMEYLASLELTTPQLCVAHCVWVDEQERRLMAERGVKVLHCPGSNLKLGSGIAPIVEMRELGIAISLGADGAACNNRLDMFDEMRLAATLQAERHGPGRLTARDVLRMATRGGAEALGLDGEIGSIEPGKRADLILVDRDAPHLQPGTDPFSTLVYAARGTDVRLTIVDGEVVAERGEVRGMDAGEVADEARRAARNLVERAGI